MLTQITGKRPLVELNCPVCGSARSKSVFSVKDYSFRVTDDEFGVRRCLDCSCGYLSPRPSEQDIALFYPPEFYWSYERESGPVQWDKIIDRRKEQLAAKVVWTENMPPGRLLDIGAQKGDFMWSMRQRGWQVEGIELDDSVPNPAGMPIRYGDFMAMDFELGSYDCITMWAVLEHVYRPADFIRRASGLLRSGGRFIALVTNFNSVQGRFFRADDCPRHLTLFTKKSVKQLCAEHGLALDRIQTDQKIFGGSLHGGLVYCLKRLLGYTHDEVMFEWKNVNESDLFCCRWRGKPSRFLRNVSRADRLLSVPFERALDRIGHGFIMTFAAVKSQEGSDV